MRFIAFIFLLSQLLVNSSCVFAQGSKTKTKAHSQSTQKMRSGNSKQNEDKSVALSRSELSKIKAVLVVGPVEESTNDYVERIKVVADYLRSIGVSVKEFYPPNDKWGNVAKAAKGAHIFVYAGHGTTCGENGKVGGLCLSNSAFVYSKTIASEMKLHDKALVLFNSVCYSGGSSASDNSDIGVKEAIKRISDYSQPFFKCGAAGYYVNNYRGSIVPFLKEFFSNRPVKEIYKQKASEYSHIETTEKNRYYQQYEVSVASNAGTGFFTRTSYTNGVRKEEKIARFKSYDVAYSGKPDFTVMDFCK